MTNFPWILPSAFASLLCLLLAKIVWKQRKRPVTRAFYWVLLTIFIWVFSRFVIMLQTDYASQLLISKFQYTGIAFTPLSWLIFALAATRHYRFINKKNILLMSIIPAITVLMAASNDAHHLLWKQISFEHHSVTARHGAWFVVHIVYSYILMGIATLLAAKEYLKHPKYKPELIAIILAPLTVLFANVNNLIGLFDFNHLDLVSIAFSISILLFYRVVVKDNYLQLVPVARAILFENMQDAIVVLNREYHIIDANPSAMKLFDKSQKNIIGKDFSGLINDKQLLESLLQNNCTELFMQGKNLQALNTHIEISSGREKGFLIVFREITELKNTQRQLEKTTQELKKANEELQVLANTDGLTKLPNRRYFFEQFSLEVSRKNRTDNELCVLILDLDHFKHINDQYGHSTGDDVLRRVAGILKSSARKHDIIGRLGGEEFGFIFPDTNLEGARKFAERLRQSIQDSHTENEIPVTVSIGLTSAEKGMDLKEIFDKADAALYQSKETGRNKVSVG